MERAPLPNWVYVDDSRWPVVRCTFTEAPRDDVFGALIDRLSVYLRRHARQAYIVDMQAVEMPSPRLRTAFFRGLRKHESLISNFVAGVALVPPQATLAFARSTMILTRSALAPCVVLDSVEAAQSWCVRQIGHKTPVAGAAPGAPRPTAKGER